MSGLMGLFFRTIALSAFIFLVASTCCQADPAYPDLELRSPFSSERALDRLQEKFPDASNAETRALLKSLDVYRYSFSDRLPTCPYPVYCGQIADPHLQYRIVQRAISLRTGQIGDAINSAIQQFAFDDGCSSLRFPAFRFLSSSSNTLVFTVEIRVLIRYCHDTIFGEVKTDIAGGWAQLFIPVNLAMSAPTLAGSWSAGSFSMGVGQPALQIYQINNHFPFLDTDAIVARIRTTLSSDLPTAFNQLIFEKTKHSLDGFVGWLNHDSFGSALPYVLLTQRGSARHRVARYRSALAELSGYGFKQSLDTNATRFLDGSTLQITYFTVIPDALLPNDYVLKQAEIDYLRGLDTDPVSVVVRKGDNLWSLAKASYRAGELWYLLAKENGITSRRKITLHVGDTLTIPPLWKLAREDACAVKVGETVWERFVKAQGSSKWAPNKIPLPLGSSNINRVFPFQCLEYPWSSAGM